jgi:hypothetical protein
MRTSSVCPLTILTTVCVLIPCQVFNIAFTPEHGIILSKCNNFMLIRIYKTIILPVVLYGSLTLGEEYRLRVLRRIFGPKRDEVTGGWRKLHN